MRWQRPALAVTLWLSISGLALGAGPAGALPQEGRAEAPAPVRQTELYAYSLRYQPASEALELVRPMLSSEGMVKLQAGTRTLEIRDRQQVVQRVAAFLRSFDHPPVTLDLEVMVVRASKAPISPTPPNSPEIPSDLVEKWRNLLSYQHYQLVARAVLGPREGEEVAYEMGAGYRIRFRLGTLLPNRRIKLHDLRLERAQGTARRELIHATLTPWLEQPLALGLAQDETSHTALMVVVVCRVPERLARPATASAPGDGREDR